VAVARLPSLAPGAHRRVHPASCGTPGACWRLTETGTPDGWSPVPLTEVSRELEALKDRLIAMSAEELTQAETEVMSREISAIRLQLKRLAFDQQALEYQLEHRMVVPAGRGGCPSRLHRSAH
jgi:hypothetical protein